MHDAAKVRPDIERPVWHLSLRAAPEDPTLSDAQWRDIAQGIGERMGWAAQPWVMVRHGEDHVHVVVSRVDFEGGVWSRRNDRLLSSTSKWWTSQNRKHHNALAGLAPAREQRENLAEIQRLRAATYSGRPSLRDFLRQTSPATDRGARTAREIARQLDTENQRRHGLRR